VSLINPTEPKQREIPEDGSRYISVHVKDGYEELAMVLVAALEQAQSGKGAERHAKDMPFTEQPMQNLIDLYGVGFDLGQAAKKSQEAQRMKTEAAVRELLGSIVYTAGAIISIESRMQ